MPDTVARWYCEWTYEDNDFWMTGTRKECEKRCSELAAEGIEATVVSS